MIGVHNLAGDAALWPRRGLITRRDDAGEVLDRHLVLGFVAPWKRTFSFDYGRYTAKSRPMYWIRLGWADRFSVHAGVSAWDTPESQLFKGAHS